MVVSFASFVSVIHSQPDPPMHLPSMKLLDLILAALSLSSTSVAGPVPEDFYDRQPAPKGQNKHLRLEKRQQFDKGQPIDATGRGAPILGNYSALYALC